MVEECVNASIDVSQRSKSAWFVIISSFQNLVCCQSKTFAELSENLGADGFKLFFMFKNELYRCIEQCTEYINMHSRMRCNALVWSKEMHRIHYANIEMCSMNLNQFRL